MKNNMRQWICTLCDSITAAPAVEAALSIIPQPGDGFSCSGCRAPADKVLLCGGYNHCREHVRLAEQRDDYVAMLVHDVKTPLLAASRALKLLADGDFGPLTASQDELIKVLIASNDATYDLITSVLEVYRFDSGLKGLALGSEDLSKVVTALVQELTPLAKDKKIQLSVSVPASCEPVYCDSVQIRRVLQNLLDNAIKFTDQGGTVHISMVQNAKECAIVVSDTGRGFSAQEQARLFKRFGQLPRDRTARTGIGLGLYLSRKIVEMHGGTISCNSVPGKGSTFRFTIPIPLCEQLCPVWDPTEFAVA